MTTTEQDDAIRELKMEFAEFGPIDIKEGLEDGVVEATVPDGRRFKIDRWGAVIPESSKDTKKGWDS